MKDKIALMKAKQKQLVELQKELKTDFDSLSKEFEPYFKAKWLSAFSDLSYKTYNLSSSGLLTDSWEADTYLYTIGGKKAIPVLNGRTFVGWIAEDAAQAIQNKPLLIDVFNDNFYTANLYHSLLNFANQVKKETGVNVEFAQLQIFKKPITLNKVKYKRDAYVFLDGQNPEVLLETHIQYSGWDIPDTLLIMGSDSGVYGFYTESAHSSSFELCFHEGDKKAVEQLISFLSSEKELQERVKAIFGFTG